MLDTKTWAIRLVFSLVLYVAAAWGWKALTDGDAAVFWTALAWLVGIRLWFALVEAHESAGQRGQGYRCPSAGESNSAARRSATCRVPSVHRAERTCERPSTQSRHPARPRQDRAGASRTARVAPKNQAPRRRAQ